MTTYLGKSCSFCLPRVPFVNCRQFMYLVISIFGFEGRIWDLIVSVPDHCLSFYFSNVTYILSLKLFGNILKLHSKFQTAKEICTVKNHTCNLLKYNNKSNNKKSLNLKKIKPVMWNTLGPLRFSQHSLKLILESVCCSSPSVYL